METFLGHFNYAAPTKEGLATDIIAREGDHNNKNIVLTHAWMPRAAAPTAENRRHA
jgi:hypothetical protein